MEQTLKPFIGRKKYIRYLTVTAPKGYRIARQSYLQEKPKSIRIFFEKENEGNNS